MASIITRTVVQISRVRTLYAYRHGDWRKLPIVENHEPLVQVPPEQCYPYYAREMKLVTDERIFLRAEALRRFRHAHAFLKRQGYDLMVYDGWRSLQLQENLFWFYLREFTAAKFNLKEQFAPLEVDAVRERFLALPETMQGSLKEANRSYVSGRPRIQPRQARTRQAEPSTSGCTGTDSPSTSGYRSTGWRWMPGPSTTSSASASLSSEMTAQSAPGGKSCSTP